MPAESISRLQRCQNNAARLIMAKRRSDHVTPLLKQLHWLPVKSRIEYKTAVLCFKSINSIAPSYVSDLVSLHIPPRPLRSSEHRLLSQTRSKKKKFGDRAFSVAGPKIWNNLPSCIRHTGSEADFRSLLKTHLFENQ